jgi:phospholipid-translocating ATPase
MGQSHEKNQNRISTTLYRFYNFLPLALLNQLKRVTNLYFILQAFLTFFPAVSTVAPGPAVIPILFVLTFSLFFDLGEDFMRFLRDKALNQKQVKVLQDNQWVSVESQHLKEGDILLVQNDEEVAADVVLLSFSSASAYAYIETANLDGEKNLKPKVPVFAKFLKNGNLLRKHPSFAVNYQPNVEFLERFDGQLSTIGEEGKAGVSKLDISNFIPRSCKVKNTIEVIGLVVYTGMDTKIMKNTRKRRVKMSRLESLMNKYIFFMLLLMMSLLVFVATYTVLRLQFGVDFIQPFFANSRSRFVLWVILVLRYFIILNPIIPISLIITLQLAKTIATWFYMLEKRNEDIHIKINSMSLHEELGQVQYVLTDKTGTLTQNKMVLRHFQVITSAINLGPQCPTIREGEFEELLLRSTDGTRQLLLTSPDHFMRLFFLGINCCHDCFSESKETKAENFDPNFVEIDEVAPMACVKSTRADMASISKTRQEEISEVRVATKKPSEKLLLRSNSIKIRRTDLAYSQTDQSVLNRVTPKDSQAKTTNPQSLEIPIEVPNSDRSRDGVAFPDIGSPATIPSSNPLPSTPEPSVFELLRDNIEIQGPSPDEIAILRASKNHCGYLFKGSTLTECVIMDDKGKDHVVGVLLKLKFDSVRKMMSVVIEVEGQLLLVSKGADNKIKSLLKAKRSAVELRVEEEVENMCGEFVKEGLRILYIGFRLLSAAEWEGLSERARRARQSADMDKEMAAIAVDLEKDLVLVGATAIEDRLQEGLEQTIVNIQKADIKLWVITGDKMETAENIAYSSGVFKRNKQLLCLKSEEDLAKVGCPNDQNLIVDGEFFGELLHQNGEVLQRFKEVVLRFDNVVFSRTNANQKVEVVKIVKGAGKLTLAIGDGANDVNMIQEADVGVGIAGEEGQQASNSADFAITRFKDLGELMFNHGRLSYNRMSALVLFFFYKNFTFTVPLFVFGFFNSFSGTLVYPILNVSFYNLLFTAFVAVARAIFDKDLCGYGDNQRTVEVLTYFNGQKDLCFNFRRFSTWIIGGIVEVCLVYFFALGAYAGHSYAHHHEPTYEFQLTFVYSVIVFHQTIKVFLLTHHFQVFQTFLYTTGFWIYIVYIFLMSDLPLEGYFGMLGQQWRAPGFYASFLFILGTLLVLSLMFFRVKTTFCPSVFDFIRNEIDRSSKDDCEHSIRNFLKEQNENRGFLQWVFS